MADDISAIKTLQHTPPIPTTHFFSRFLFRSLIAIIFFTFIPLFPSFAPEFLADTWELLHIVFVGIAVSYGLFSRIHHGSCRDSPLNSDSPHSYLSKFLHISSIFDEKVNSPIQSSDEFGNINKLQTWSSQYFRNDLVVVVANKQGSALRDDKPLLLPARSLKSRVADVSFDVNSRVSGRSFIRSRSNSSSSGNEDNRFLGYVNGGFELSSSNSSSNGGLNYTGTSANGELSDYVDGDCIGRSKEDDIVFPSPVSWRSESTRMEMKEDVDPVAMIDPARLSSRSALVESSSSVSSDNGVSTCNDLKRGVWSEPKDLRSKLDSSLMGNASFSDYKNEFGDFFGSVLAMSDDNEGGSENEAEDCRISVKNPENEEDDGAASLGSCGDEGPDVDKKADKFIAKFREQIRLQWMNSNTGSTAQLGRSILR